MPRHPTRVSLALAVLALVSIACEGKDGAAEDPPPKASPEQIRIAEVALDSAANAVTLFQVRTRALPASPDALVDGRYVDKMPTDPWGNALTFDREGELLVGLRFAGPDGETGTDDDIARPFP